MSPLSVIRPQPIPVREPTARRIQFPVLLGAWAQLEKRIIDIGFASLLALIALPLCILIGFAILIESGRPVLFIHDRIGRGRRVFGLWKFRSMVLDSVEVMERYLANHPEAAVEWELTHKLKNDPRVTRVGRFLRRTSLDELPQLWNVLKGEMTLVGPRPIVAGEVAKYGSAYSLYARVAPGLTGLWQVSGRNDMSYRRRVELESRYIRDWTLALDLRILLRTIGVVLTGKGAY
jgi:lipopolysaccharide/colanic/teichoic acid biosynthesis glycosyltransferase